MNESDWGFFLHDCETETICLKESGLLAWCMLNLNGEGTNQVKQAGLGWSLYSPSYNERDFNLGMGNQG